MFKKRANCNPNCAFNKLKIEDMQVSKSKNEVLDELDKTEHEQLHRVVLSFSDQSFKFKQILLTTLVAIATVSVAIFRDNFQLFLEHKRIFFLGIFLLVALFWLMDAMANYYLNRLRRRMIQSENRILERYDLETKPIDEMLKSRLRKFIKLSKVIRADSHFLFYYVLVGLLTLMFIHMSLFAQP